MSSVIIIHTRNGKIHCKGIIIINLILRENSRWNVVARVYRHNATVSLVIRQQQKYTIRNICVTSSA